jgi:hypothetical protein
VVTVRAQLDGSRESAAAAVAVGASSSKRKAAETPATVAPSKAMKVTLCADPRHPQAVATYVCPTCLRFGYETPDHMSGTMH